MTVLQGTVKRFDPADGGSLLLDDGRELAFPAAALRPEVRLLRLGQRVRLLLHGDEVVAVTLVTFQL